MNTITFLSIIGIIIDCLFPLFLFINNKIKLIEFPVFYALTIAGWFLPQFIAEANSGNLPQEAITKSGIMAFLCFTGALCGYAFYKPRTKYVSNENGNVLKLKDRLIIVTLILLIPFFIIRQLPQENMQGGWSGTPVVLLFFYSGLKYTAWFSFFLFLGGDKSKKVLLILFIGLMYYFLVVIGAGRRADSLELFFLIIGGLYFIKKTHIPKTFIFVSALLFVVFTSSISNYRSIVIPQNQNKLKLILNIDWLENLKRNFVSTGGEVSNYIMGLYAIDQSNNYDYGLFHWNSIIMRFIPRQYLGNEFKEELLAPIEDPVGVAGHYGQEAMVGQTHTGMLDAFHSFWFFGFLNFIIIGIFFKFLYVRACHGLLSDQIFYLFLITSGLHTITHTSNWCFFAFIHLWIFTFPYRKFGLISWPPDSRGKL